MDDFTAPSATAEVDRCMGLLYKGIGQKIESEVLAFILRNGRDKILVYSGVRSYADTAQFKKYFNQTQGQTVQAQLERDERHTGY